MSTPTAEPVAKPQPEGKASFSFRHPFARATKEDVARGVTNSFSLLLFFFWPLAVLYFLATLPIQLWRIRHRLYPFHIRVRRVLFWNTILLYVTIGGLFFGLIINLVQNQVASRLLLGLLGLAVGISAVANGVGRLHDRNISGWWILLYYGLPAGTIIGLVIAQPSVETLGFFEMALFPFVIWTFVALGFRGGTAGPNRFGPETVRRSAAPKAPPLPANVGQSTASAPASDGSRPR